MPLKNSLSVGAGATVIGSFFSVEAARKEVSSFVDWVDICKFSFFLQLSSADRPSNKCFNQWTRTAQRRDGRTDGRHSLFLPNQTTNRVKQNIRLIHIRSTKINLQRFWPRPLLKGPKRSFFVVVLLLLGVEESSKNVTNKNENYSVSMPSPRFLRINRQALWILFFLSTQKYSKVLISTQRH